MLLLFEKRIVFVVVWLASFDLLFFCMQFASKQSEKGQIKNVDTKLYTSWMNGRIRFQDQELSEIAKEMERWFDVSFHFQDISTASLRFTGVIDRNLSLQEILELLETMTNIKFKIEKNVVTVLKKQNNPI